MNLKKKLNFLFSKITNNYKHFPISSSKQNQLTGSMDQNSIKSGLKSKLFSALGFHQNPTS